MSAKKQRKAGQFSKFQEEGREREREKEEERNG